MLSGYRNQSQCELLCFRDCDNSYEELIVRNQVDIAKPQKLSLRKVLQNESCLPQKGLINSNSFKNLQKRRSQTNRSNKSKKEYKLFRKKQLIENQICEVDKQMNKLTMKYENKIKQLKNVRRQLQKIKQH